MRTKCANCGMIYDITISDMDFRTPLEVSQSGVCPKCGSNAHDPLPGGYSSTLDFEKAGEEVKISRIEKEEE